MHELSIVMSIVEIAEGVVAKEKASQVDCIELEIGTMAGIELSALYFSWDLAVKDTVLDGATRTIHEIKARVRCSGCNLKFYPTEAFDPCPQCGEILNVFLCGKELNVKSLSVS
jgi:hydrogenase nickel incorporation protein HypA/HybF